MLVTDIQEELGRQVASDCGGIFVAHDTAIEDDWVQAFQTATAELGDVSILFNNAGVRPKTAPLEDTTLEDWQAHMAINMDGVFLGIKHAIRAMKEKGGAIVSTSSIYGIAGAAMIGAYSASKGGVRTLTKAAAMECAYFRYPIRITNSIHPSFIETGHAGIDQAGIRCIHDREADDWRYALETHRRAPRHCRGRALSGC